MPVRTLWENRNGGHGSGMGREAGSGTIAYTMRPEEAAVMLGVSKFTVYRWVRAGLLPGKKIGRLWLIPRHELTLAVRTRPLPGLSAGSGREE